ncbi:hypothetical protein HK405_014235 [Cladochytrium tenue]|nr:hypothetical protein HK405_014235 [Cladochytrium tenue]
MTVMYGDDWSYPVALANKQAYANRHGYDLIVLDNPARDAPAPLAADAANGDPTPHPVWSKVSGLRKHVRDYAWLWLLDADAFITNSAVRVEDYVKTVEMLHLNRSSPIAGGASRGRSPSRAARRVAGPPPSVVLEFPAVHDNSPRLGPDLILGMDCNGLNAGSLFVRGARSGPEGESPDSAHAADDERRAWIVQLVDFWLAMEPLPEVHSDGLLEQRGLGMLVEANVMDVRRHVAVVPLRTLNSYAPDFTKKCVATDDPYSQAHQAGDWVIHFVDTSKRTMRRKLSELGLLP